MSILTENPNFSKEILRNVSEVQTEDLLDFKSLIHKNITVISCIQS